MSVTINAWFKQRRTWLRLLQLTPFFWIAIWFLSNITILPLWYGRVLVNLEAEFHQITPPPQVQLFEYESKSIGDRATITARYVTAADYSIIRQSYDHSLTKDGWSYSGEDGYIVEYCKGNFTATLDHSTYPSSEYEFWLIAGATSSCEMSKGGGIIQMSFYDLVLLFGWSLTFWLPYAGILGWAAWRMSPPEFQRFRSELISKPKSIEEAYTWAIACFLIGVLLLLGSVYKITAYLINW